MNVTVQYTTQLRAAVGQTEQTIQVPEGLSLLDLLQHLGQLHPDAFARFVWDDADRILPNLILTVNNQQVSDLPGYTVSDGDTITLLSAISGG